MNDINKQQVFSAAMHSSDHKIKKKYIPLINYIFYIPFNLITLRKSSAQCCSLFFSYLHVCHCNIRE